VFFAHYWNGDELYVSDFIGVFFIISGAVVFGLTSSRSETYSEVELVQKFFSQNFVIYFIIQILAMLLLMGTIATSEIYKLRITATERFFSPLLRRMQQGEMRRRLQLEHLREKVALLEAEVEKKTGIKAIVSKSEVALPDIEGELFPVTEHWIDQYIYAACSGTVGGMSLLFAGCTSRMLMRLFHGNYSEYEHPAPYLIIGGMVACLILQTHLLNVAMKTGDTMSVYPVFQAFWIFFGVVGGVVYYQIGTVNAVGTCVMMIGIVFLIQHSKKANEKKAVISISPSFEDTPIST